MSSPAMAGALFPGCVLLQRSGNDPSDTGKIHLSCMGTRHRLAYGSVLHGTDSRIHAVLFLHLNRDSPAGMNSFTTPLLLSRQLTTSVVSSLSASHVLPWVEVSPIHYQHPYP